MPHTLKQHLYGSRMRMDSQLIHGGWNIIDFIETSSIYPLILLRSSSLLLRSTACILGPDANGDQILGGGAARVTTGKNGGDDISPRICWPDRDKLGTQYIRPRISGVQRHRLLPCGARRGCVRQWWRQRWCLCCRRAPWQLSGSGCEVAHGALNSSCRRSQGQASSGSDKRNRWPSAHEGRRLLGPGASLLRTTRGKRNTHVVACCCIRLLELIQSLGRLQTLKSAIVAVKTSEGLHG